MISCEYSSAIKEESAWAGTVSLAHAESNNATTPALSCAAKQRDTSASTESEKDGISGSRKATVSTKRQKESACSSSEPPPFPGAHIQVHNKREWAAITKAQRDRLIFGAIFYRMSVCSKCKDTNKIENWKLRVENFTLFMQKCGYFEGPKAKIPTFYTISRHQRIIIINSSTCRVWNPDQDILALPPRRWPNLRHYLPSRPYPQRGGMYGR